MFPLRLTRAQDEWGSFSLSRADVGTVQGCSECPLMPPALPPAGLRHGPRGLPAVPRAEQKPAHRHAVQGADLLPPRPPEGERGARRVRSLRTLLSRAVGRMPWARVWPRLDTESAVKRLHLMSELRVATPVGLAKGSRPASSGSDSEEVGDGGSLLTS